MGWEVIAGLIIEIGVPATKALIEKWQKGGPVTLEEFEELEKMANETAADRAKQVLGNDPTVDPKKAADIIALTERPATPAEPPAPPQ